MSYITYVSKSDLSYCQEVPVPDDLENWHKVVIDDPDEIIDAEYNAKKKKWEKKQDRINDSIMKKRREQYIDLTDQLFMQWQYAKAIDSDDQEDLKQEWLDEVDKIKKSLPKQTGKNK